MTSFGQDLKRERELREISLKEIADFSKISLRFLKALETDRLDMLPGKFFTRGIIRTYAKYLGLEEEAVLNQYFEITQEQKKKNKIKAFKEEPPPKYSPKKQKFIPFTIYAILAVVILLSLIFLLRKREGNSLDRVTLPQPAINLKIKDMAPSSLTSGEQVKEMEVLHLKLIFHQETWIQVSADGKIELEKIMSAGQQAEIKAIEKLLINVRNAGGLTYFINNREGKPLGKSGDNINYIRINWENYEDFLK